MAAFNATVSQTFKTKALPVRAKFVQGYTTTDAYTKSNFWASDNGSYLTIAAFLHIPDAADMDGWGHIVGNRRNLLQFENWALGPVDKSFYIRATNVTDVGFFWDTGGIATHGIDVGDWFAIMFSVDYSGVGVPPVLQLWTHKLGAAAAIDLTGSGDLGTPANGPVTLVFDEATPLEIASLPFNGEEADFNYCELYITNEYVDWSVLATRNKYVNPNNGIPIGLGVDGSDLTGTAAKIYIPDGDATNNIGTEGNFTELGAITESTTGPRELGSMLIFASQPAITADYALYESFGFPLSQSVTATVTP